MGELLLRSSGLEEGSGGVTTEEQRVGGRGWGELLLRSSGLEEGSGGVTTEEQRVGGREWGSYY